MKKTRRVFCLILGVIMCASLLAGCGNGEQQTSSSAPPAESSAAPSASSSPAANSGAAAPSPTTSSIFGDVGSMTLTGDEETEETRYREELTIIIDQNTISAIDSFSPGTPNVTRWALYCFLDRLVTEVSGEYQPMLATSWETTDWQHFNFKLRDDIYFHNGEKFTADDIVYTVERASNSPGAVSYDWLSGIDNIEVVNDYEINITLAGVNVDFLYFLSQPHSGIVNRKACETDEEKGVFIGTGPWVVDEFVPSEYVTFLRNEDYWRELPKTKVLTLKYVANIAAKVMMLEKDEAQFALGLDPSDFPYLESSPEFDTYKYTDNNCQWMGFNMNDPICSDINFRKAIASVINTEELALACRNGYAVPETTGSFWGFATEFKDNSIPQIPYDIEKAKEYLEMSSYNGETVEIVAAFADKLIMSEWIQEQCKAIGVNIEIYQTDVAGMGAYAKFTDNQAQMISHTGSWSNLATSVRAYYYPNASSNRASYVNDEVTALLDLAPSITDTAEREKIYKQIQQLAAQDIPFINIYYLTQVAACLPGLAGITLKADSGHDFSYVYMPITD